MQVEGTQSQESQIGVAVEESQAEEANAERPAGGGMRDSAPTWSQIVTLRMSARNAEVTPTQVRSASSRMPSINHWAHQPCYVQDLVWTNNVLIHTMLVAWTESTLPLPSPPVNELSNLVALQTIQENSHLFKTVTPIDVDHLEHLLIPHPNRPLVLWMCHGFQEGFWPWTITEGVVCPLVVDNSFHLLSEESHINFTHEQHDVEVALECFSPAFGPELLPGMTSIPIGVVPKPHSDKLCLVVDQSSGDYSPNSLIPCELVAVPLDSLHDLGVSLINAHLIHGRDIALVVFKSDMSQAY